MLVRSGVERSAVSPNEDPEREQRAPLNHRALLLHVVAALGVLATLVGRALSPALPGSVAGISGIIRVVDLAGNLLTQLFAFAGISSALLLARVILQSSKKDLVFKLLVLPATLLVGFIVMVKMRVTQSDPNGSMTLALTSSGLAMVAAPALLKNEVTRVMGLTVALGGAGGGLHALGRFLAFKASLASLPTHFMIARGCETAVFTIHLAVVALACLWLKSRGPAFAAKLAGIAALCVLGAIGAERGSLPDASVWEVLASRSVGHLSSAPLPLIPTSLVSSVILLTLALAVWLLATRQLTTTAVVLCFCLLSGGSTDVPLLALALVLATIVAKLPPEPSAPAAAKASAAKRNESR